MWCWFWLVVLVIRLGFGLVSKLLWFYGYVARRRAAVQLEQHRLTGLDLRQCGVEVF